MSSQEVDPASDTGSAEGNVSTTDMSQGSRADAGKQSRLVRGDNPDGGRATSTEVADPSTGDAAVSRPTIMEVGGADASVSASTMGDAASHSEPRCGDGVVDTGELCDGNCSPEDMCRSDNACIAAVFSGGATTCDAHCDMTAVSACVAGDGCCPTGCKYPSDDDCSPSCGDGVVTGNELCEAQSAEKPCPNATDCTDDDPCTDNQLMGTATECNAQCISLQITSAKSGDRCCPSGANANNDDDCDPVCGNGVKERDELCDGDCPRACARPQGCQQEELQGSSSDCNAKCVRMMVTARVDGDGCCPSGANATNDSDCPGCRSPADCGSGQTCREGECVCSGTPSSSNREHCGTCGNACGPSEECIGGRCIEEPCGNGRIDSGEDCDPNASGWTNMTCNPATCKRTVYKACWEDADCEYIGGGCYTVPVPMDSIYVCTPSCARGVSECPTIPGVASSQYLCSNDGYCFLHCDSPSSCPGGLTCMTVGAENLCVQRTTGPL